VTSGVALRFLSDEYLAELERLVPANQRVIPHVNVRLQVNATDTPEGLVEYYLLIEKGVIGSACRGRIEDSDLTISTTYADLAAFQAGELHAATAFVTGQFQVTGDKAKLLELMLVVQSGNYHGFTAELWARTTRR
jgi:hypothetical protein